MIEGYGFRATHGRNADDRYSALPGGGAFLHRMHAVSVEWDESRTHEKVVRARHVNGWNHTEQGKRRIGRTHEKVIRAMEARMARQRLASYGTGEAAHWLDARKVVRVMEACTARRINFLIFPIIQREENPAMIRQYI